MTYWLLIILIFNPQWELQEVHLLDALKTRKECIRVMTNAALGQPEYTHMHCFPGKIPLPTYRLPAKGDKMIESELPPEFFDEFANLMEEHYEQEYKRRKESLSRGIFVEPIPETDWDAELKRLLKEE